MIMIAGALVGIATVPLFRGRFGSLVHVKMRLGWLVFLAIFLQTAVVSIFNKTLTPTSAAALHMLSYAATALFVIANRRISGLWLIGLGGLMNLIPIAANGGVMPARPAAVRQAGLKPPDGFENSRVVTDPQFEILGDIFAIPARFPLANVFSIGDLVLNIGLILVLHDATGSRLLWFLRPKKQPEMLAPDESMLGDMWRSEATSSQ
jgi:Family of unknown function (DUF5317)